MPPSWEINFPDADDGADRRRRPRILGASCGRYLFSGWTPGSKFPSATAAEYWLSSGPSPEHTVATGFYVIVDTQMSLVGAGEAESTGARIEDTLAGHMEREDLGQK